MAKDIRIAVDLKDLRRFPQKAKEIDAMLQHSFDQIIQRVYLESQILVPVKTGALKASGKVVNKPIGASGLPESAVTYGDDNVDYAVIVHEDLQHAHADPTSAKYLEIPLLHNRPALVELVAKRLAQLVTK